MGAIQEIKEGPYAFGEDIRFAAPKQRGGLGNFGGYKALSPSGLMGDEFQAWWPAPPVHRQVRPEKGGTLLENACPFAIGRGMDVYDKRTFDPHYTREQWAVAHRELRANPATVGEMERTLKQGLTLLASRLQASASQAPSVASGGAARSALSRHSTRPREGGVVAEETRPSTAHTEMTVRGFRVESVKFIFQGYG